LADVDAGKVSLDAYEVAHGEDIPEWTDGDFARARPISDFPELMAALKGTRGERGPQKAPVKERIGLRLDPNVVAHFRRTGPGWQGRINAVLMDYVKAEEK
jgi:uncharacterized protein (DUF4415 family)